MKALSSDWQDYDLLDSGQGRKLERFGPYTLVRPEPSADWQPVLPQTTWDRAHAEFRFDRRGREGHWRLRQALPERWPLQYRGLRFWVQARESRQVGVFPENATHWDWIGRQIARAERPVHVLNLFGYTGLATLAAARAGARVTHVDASKKAVTWARDNQALSGLADRPVRWIVDDALKYVSREERRGVRYDGIVMDPPAFGRGPQGEVWAFDRLFPGLCDACRAVLAPAPLFVVVTAYTKSVDAAWLEATVADTMAGFGGSLEVGELVTRERSGGRTIANALYARWAA